MKVISEIKKDSQGISRLYVDNEPFLILGIKNEQTISGSGS